MKKYLSQQARYRKEADGVFEAVIDALNQKGGYNWQETLCQSDLIATMVETVRAFESARLKC